MKLKNISKLLRIIKKFYQPSSREDSILSIKNNIKLLSCKEVEIYKKFRTNSIKINIIDVLRQLINKSTVTFFFWILW